MKIKRCPLILLFGKDIANLIYLTLWKSQMSNVTSEYRNVFDISEQSTQTKFA